MRLGIGAARLSIAAMASAIALASTFSNADTFTLTPTADAYVTNATVSQVDQSATNFGNAPVLATRTVSTARYKSYIQFNLSGIDLTKVDAVTLKLTATNASGAAAGSWQAGSTWNVWGVKDLSFVEGNGGTDNSPTNELTWSNSGSYDNSTGSNVNFSSPAVLLGTFDTPGAAAFTFVDADLTSLVQSASPNGTITLLISGGASGTTQWFGSRDSGFAPVLTVSMPEPAGMSVLVLGCVSLLTGRRRTHG